MNLTPLRRPLMILYVGTALAFGHSTLADSRYYDHRPYGGQYDYRDGYDDGYDHGYDDGYRHGSRDLRPRLRHKHRLGKRLLRRLARHKAEFYGVIPHRDWDRPYRHRRDYDRRHRYDRHHRYDRRPRVNFSFSIGN